MLSEEEIARILEKFKCGDGNLTDTGIEYSSESESDSEIFPTTLSVDFAGIDNSDDSDSSEDNRTGDYVHQEKMICQLLLILSTKQVTMLCKFQNLKHSNT